MQHLLRAVDEIVDKNAVLFSPCIEQLCVHGGTLGCLCAGLSVWLADACELLVARATFTTLIVGIQGLNPRKSWARACFSPVHANSLLQDAGVLISRKAHGAHHRAPFEGNYCIVSGAWNPLLDAGGSSDGFFRRLERYLHSVTGVEPRCWHEPLNSWAEMER
jgi:Lipid desaturase domain